MEEKHAMTVIKTLPEALIVIEHERLVSDQLADALKDAASYIAFDSGGGKSEIIETALLQYRIARGG